MLDRLVYKQIASRTRVSIRTFETYVHNLSREMEVRSHHQLIHRVTTAEHEECPILRHVSSALHSSHGYSRIPRTHAASHAPRGGRS